MIAPELRRGPHRAFQTLDKGTLTDDLFSRLLLDWRIMSKPMGRAAQVKELLSCLREPFYSMRRRQNLVEIVTTCRILYWTGVTSGRGLHSILYPPDDLCYNNGCPGSCSPHVGEYRKTTSLGEYEPSQRGSLQSAIKVPRLFLGHIRFHTRVPDGT